MGISTNILFRKGTLLGPCAIHVVSPEAVVVSSRNATGEERYATRQKRREGDYYTCSNLSRNTGANPIMNWHSVQSGAVITQSALSY